MIVVDVETTGLNPEKHSIVSVGAINFSNPKIQFYQECKIWDGAEVTQEALKINGFSQEAIKNTNKKSLEEIMKDFLKWTQDIEDKTIAGENPTFDRDFLKASAQRYNIDWQFGYRTVDLHSLCYAHYLSRGLTPPTKNRIANLGTDIILKYVGLPEEPNPHNALTGAKMEAEALSRLILGESLLEEFKGYSIPNYLL